jgi:hypothetical protein
MLLLSISISDVFIFVWLNSELLNNCVDYALEGNI